MGSQYELGLPVDPLESKASQWYDLPRISAVVDYINVLTFEYQGPWNP